MIYILLTYYILQRLIVWVSLIEGVSDLLNIKCYSHSHRIPEMLQCHIIEAPAIPNAMAVICKGNHRNQKNVWCQLLLRVTRL